jgi:hypothetical protein
MLFREVVARREVEMRRVGGGMLFAVAMRERGLGDPE